MSVELLQRWIQYPTISSNPILEFATELAERAESLHGCVHRFETSATKQNIVVQFGPEGKEGLGLSGHMDVVPVEGQNWQMDPFKGIIEAGSIYGRGACDMKAFLATTYGILERLPIQRLRKGISLIWTHDEEIGCVGSSHLPTQCTNLTLPENILIGEPTSLQLFHHHGGHCTIEVSVKGFPAHSSKPYLGVSATEWLFEAWQVIREWEQWLSQQVSPITHEAPLLNIAQITAGTAVNIIPEHAKIQLGFRPMPGHCHHSLMQNLEQRLQPLQAHALEKGASILFEIKQAAPPLYTALPTPLEQAILQLAPTTKSLGAPFATDGGCLAEMNLKPLIWGPGSIDVAHQPNEYVRIEELQQYEQQLESLIRNWCL